MTSWSPVPLRQAGQAWPGIDTEGGKLDNGTGQLDRDAVNCTINEADTLSKRKGFIRGLNERFGTVVCGLHTYTSNCGVEYLIVADDTGMSIRTPFVVPVFTVDDSYPIDDFEDVFGLDENDWRNTAIYSASGGSLLRAVGNSVSPFDAGSFLRWFKPASSISYQVQVEYAFTPLAGGVQVVSISIKGNGDLTSGARLQADLVFEAATMAYSARLWLVTAAGAFEQKAQIDVLGSFTNPSGFLTLSFASALVGGLPTFTATIEVVPIGGALQTQGSSDISELQARDLGQVSAIGCNQNAAITAVSGGRI